MKFTGYESISSWLVTLGCSFIMLITSTPSRISGLLFVSFIEYYETDRETASIPIFLYITIRCLGGPLCAVLSEKLGTETLIIYGTIVATIGFGGCFFARNVLEVSILLGIVFGVGVTGSNALLPTILKKFFNKNINTANGISQAGACVGAVVIAPMAVYLLELYGLPGTYLITSGIMLNAVPVGMLLQKAAVIQDKIIASIKNRDKLLENEPENNQKLVSTDTELLKVEEPLYAKQQLKFKQQESFVLDSKVRQDTEVTETNELKENPCEVVYNQDDKHIVNKEEREIQFIDCSKGYFENRNTSNYDMNKEIEELILKSPDSEISNINDIKAYVSIIENNKNLSKQNLVVATNTDLAVDMESKPLFDTCDNFPIRVEDSKPQKKGKLYPLKVFMVPSYLIILLSTGLHNFIVIMVWTTTIDYSRDKNISREYEVYYLMIHPVCEIIGRMSFGWVTDLGYLTICKYSMLCFALMGFTCGWTMWAINVWSMMFGALGFAVTSGAVSAVFPGMIFNYIPEEFHKMAIASRYSLSGPLILSSTPLLGLFRETLGSYDGLYLFFVAICLCCVVMMPLLNKFSLRCIK